MESMLEALMVLCLCAAAGIMLYRFMKNGAAPKAADRCTASAMGLGFIAGAAAKAAAEPLEWTFVLYLLGAMLCYTAVLFSIPEREVGSHE